MATGFGMYGAETGDNADATAGTDPRAYVSDGTARSGSYYFKVQTTAATGGHLKFDTTGAWTDWTANVLASTERKRGKMRFFFRLVALPTATIVLGGFGTNTDGILQATCAVDSTGHFAAKSGTTVGTFSTAVLATGRWYRCDVELDMVNNAGTATRVTAVTIYEDDHEELTATTRVERVNSTSTSAALSATQPVLGGETTTSATKHIHYDDAVWVWAAGADAALPVVFPGETSTSQYETTDTWVGNGTTVKFYLSQPLGASATGVIGRGYVTNDGVNEPIGVTTPPYWLYDATDNTITRTTAPDATNPIEFIYRIARILQPHRIYRAAVTGQGSLNGFTVAGAFTSVDEIPVGLGGGLGDNVTSSVDESATTYTHTPATDLDVTWIKCNAAAKASVEADHALLIAGVEHTVTLSVANYTRMSEAAYNVVGYTPAAFGALEFGIRNKTGATVTLGAAMLEVLAATHSAEPEFWIGGGIYRVRRDPDPSISHGIDAKPGTVSIKVEGAAAPECGQHIEIRFDGLLLFQGIVQTVEQVYDLKPTQLAWNLTCVDWLWLLNRRLPFGEWEATSATTVVAELLADFAPDFTTTNVQAALPNVTITLDRSKTMTEALLMIAGLLPGGHLRVIGPDLYFYITETDDPPDAITDATTDLSLLDPPLTSSTDASQVRNRIYIKGSGRADSTTYEAPVQDLITTSDVGTTGGSMPTNTFYRYGLTAVTADGETSGLPHSAMFLSSPNNAVDLGLQVSPDVRVTGRRLWRTSAANNGQGDLFLLTTLNNVVATYKDVADDTGLSADVMPTFNDTASIWAMVEDTDAQTELAALEGGDGIHEHYISDTSLDTIEKAEARGEAELAVFARPITTVKYATRDTKTRTGKTIDINLTNPPLVAQLKILDVNVDQIDVGGNLMPRYNVTASTMRFTLEDLLAQIGSGGGGGGGGNASAGGAGVEFTSLATIATAKVLGRSTAGTGVIEALGTLPNAVQDTITRLGTIANIGAPLGVGFGGTGATAFTLGSIVFAGTSGVYTQSNASLFWDNSTKRLGIGTTAPAVQLAIHDVGEAKLVLRSDSDNNSADTDVFIRFEVDAGTIKGVMGYDQGLDRFVLGHGVLTQFSIDANSIVGVGANARPSSGATGIILGAGTAFSGMPTDTAGYYAVDVAGTVQQFAINEAGVTNQLTGLHIRKTGDESVATNTIQADDHLTRPLEASSAYAFEIKGFWTTASATAGMKVQLDGTVGVSSLKADVAYSGGTPTRVTAFNSAVTSAATGDQDFIIKGTITTSTAGTFFLEWAQSVTDGAAATTVQENSYMVLWKLNA